MADTSRKFSMLDAMVLVAATAAALGIARSLGRSGFSMILEQAMLVTAEVGGNSSTFSAMKQVYLNEPALGFYQPKWLGVASLWLQRVGLWPTPFLAAWSLALLGLGLREPARSRRRLIRRPGWAACLAILPALALSALRWPEILGPRSGIPAAMDMKGISWWAQLWSSLPMAAGLAVAASWFALAMSGRWVASCSCWRDRLGRAFGVGWIVMAMAILVRGWVVSFAR